MRLLRVQVKVNIWTYQEGQSFLLSCPPAALVKVYSFLSSSKSVHESSCGTSSSVFWPAVQFIELLPICVLDSWKCYIGAYCNIIHYCSHAATLKFGIIIVSMLFFSDENLMSDRCQNDGSTSGRHRIFITTFIPPPRLYQTSEYWILLNDIQLFQPLLRSITHPPHFHHTRHPSGHTAR